MKTEVDKQSSFKPVIIKLTFETQDELDRFGALTNYSPFTNKFLDFGDLFEDLKANGSDIHKYIETLNDLIKRD